MPQNLVSLELSSDTIAVLDQAVATLEEFAQPLVSLSAEEIRGLTKMGDKSAEFCRQTAMVLGQNRASLPPSFDYDEMKSDIAAYDALASRVLRLKEVLAKLEDTQIALGSDIMVAASDGYSLMKMFGKAEGLNELKQAMLVRRPGRPRKVAGSA